MDRRLKELLILLVVINAGRLIRHFYSIDIIFQIIQILQIVIRIGACDGLDSLEDAQHSDGNQYQARQNQRQQADDGNQQVLSPFFFYD